MFDLMKSQFLAKFCGSSWYSACKREETNLGTARKLAGRWRQQRQSGVGTSKGNEEGKCLNGNSSSNLNSYRMLNPVNCSIPRVWLLKPGIPYHLYKPSDHWWVELHCIRWLYHVLSADIIGPKFQFQRNSSAILVAVWSMSNASLRLYRI